ncbi:hypothetical protein ACS0TY_004637 [Phlomoides rotata]
MESGSEEEEGWEMVDYYPEEEKSRLGWVIDAGKKLVITGVVVSSIPILLPPLVVISSLGLAFSLPYGVVFASYACTQKLMNKLLPPPPPPPPTHHLLCQDDDVVMNVEVGGVDAKEEREGEKDDEKIITETKREEKEENGTNEKILTEAKTKEENVQVGSKETAKQRKTKKNKKEGDSPKPESGVVIAVVQEEEEINKGNEKIQVPSVIVQDDSVEYYDSADGKGTELKEQDKGIATEDQESFRDDKIWEKISAIREISGFKAPRRDSYYEELKALYLFTGIEAPSTSPDASDADFVEFYSKLSFLMSVIGLK